MPLLILGLALWAAGHGFKRAAPDVRARMGDRGKGLVTAILLLSIVAMVFGYRSAEFIPVWDPPVFARHLNNLIMVIAFYLFGVGAAKGLTAKWLRHPQLTAVVLWAAAHLIVNGDLASIVLFGGLLVWALAEMVVLNRAAPWQRPADTSIKGDAVALIVGLFIMSIAAGIHLWLGVNPFGG